MLLRTYVKIKSSLINIVAAFRGMHVSPAKHSSGSVTDGRTDRQTDDGQSDPYVSLCFAGDTKSVLQYLRDMVTDNAWDQQVPSVCSIEQIR